MTTFVSSPTTNSTTTMSDRRAEPRLRYSWQMYFQLDRHGRVEQGRMVDLSRTTAAFLAKDDGDLAPDQQLHIRLTHPMVQGELFGILEVRRSARIIRLDPYISDHKRVAVRFDAPLDYEPAGDTPSVCGAAPVF
ncbi:MAG: PilZ domain-containing protein [Phycisphaerae bacterium]|nr:PilZ domain-containing protein [Phycisphaerae bacterium]